MDVSHNTPVYTIAQFPIRVKHNAQRLSPWMTAFLSILPGRVSFFDITGGITGVIHKSFGHMGVVRLSCMRFKQSIYSSQGYHKAWYPSTGSHNILIFASYWSNFDTTSCCPDVISNTSDAKAYHFRSRIETTAQKPGNLVNHKYFMLTSFPFSRPLLSDRGLFSGDKLRLFITTWNFIFSPLLTLDFPCCWL